MKSEYKKQADEFLARNGIKLRATLSDTKSPAWADGDKFGHHYRVTLSKPGKRVVFDFWGSVKDMEDGRDEVGAYDVLACISGDVSCPDSFDQFCQEFGYDHDSIKALQLFRRCSRFASRLQEFFTSQEIEQLQEIQ